MKRSTLLYTGILIVTAVAPFLFPAYGQQLATLWLMIIVALTWDMTGGQMGYNSLGNIFFYGTGMYVAAVVGISMAYNVGDYTNAAGGGIYKFTDGEYFGGIFLGSIAAGLFCAACAVVVGWITFGLRGPYFAPDASEGRVASERFRLDMECGLIELAGHSHEAFGEPRPAGLQAAAERNAAERKAL